MRWLFLLLALSPILATESRADMHFGPLINFEIYHRRAPEETDSVRLGFGVSFSSDIAEGWPMAQAAALFVSGIDSFASQNTIDEKIYRGRLGLIWKPFHFDTPLVGFRLGGQLTRVQGIYNKKIPVSTDTLHPAYFTPYIGVIAGISPLAGFGVEEEFTTFYDSYFKSWIYQFSFGIPLK